MPNTSQEVTQASACNRIPRFPSAEHLASWAGICPGNDQSAGKRRSGRMPKGNRWLKRTLCQAAWAASRTKGSYLASQHRRISSRRGGKKAAMAVGHSQLVSIYMMLQRRVGYQELGETYLDRLQGVGLSRRLVKRLENLGYEVSLKAKVA